MAELSDVEARLSSLFQAVARQVPDEPAAGWAPADGLDLYTGDAGDGSQEALEMPDASAATGSSGAGRWRRRATGAAVISGAVIIGTGVAAATGMLSPSAVQQNVQHTLTPAMSMLGSPDPAAVPGAVVRLTTPGPEGTVLQVVSDDGNNNDLVAGSCVAVTVMMPSGAPAPGAADADRGGCEGVVAESLGGTLPAADRTSQGALVTTSWWVAPSGQGYTIEFGDGGPGTAAVALTDAQANIGAKAQAVDGWYAVYIASSLYTTFDNLTFFNASGQVVSSGPLIDK